MRVIGLTGGIACGKSNVSEALRRRGIPVIDTDQISRSLTAEGGEAIPAIREQFGKSVFYEDGSLNRKALGKLVFQNADARKKLNDLMHPMIWECTLAELQRVRNTGTECCVLEVPLLFETGMNRLCDTVWCVSLPYREQLKRLMERNGLSRGDADARIRSQMPGWLRALRSDHVISSIGTREETAQKAIDLLERTENISKA